MKYGLIMENWRRYQTLEDDNIIFENKKISYDGLLLRFDRNEIDPMVFLETLDEHISRKCDLFMNKLNENMFSKGFKSLATRALKFVVNAIEKIQKFLNSIDFAVGAGIYKVIKKCLGIIQKVTPVAVKISKVLGPIARVSMYTLLLMVLTTSTAYASSSGVEVDQDVLNVIVTALQDLTLGNEDQASELMINQTFGSTEVFVDNAEVVSSVTKHAEILGNENNGIDKAIEAAKSLIQKMDGKPMSEEEFKNWLNTLDAEVALNIEDARVPSEAMKTEDPETFKVLAAIGEKIKVVQDSHTDSTIQRFQASISKGGVDKVVDSVSSATQSTVKSRFETGT
jgi:hypothetical protein